MNPSAIYSKSGKGVQEASGKTSLLKRGDRAVLSAIDGRATLAEVAQKVGKPFDGAFEQLIRQLDKDGFVREVTSAGPTSTSSGARPTPTLKPAPAKPAPKAPPPSAGAGEDLDFTAIMPAMKPGAAAPKPAAPAAPPPPAVDKAAEQRAKEQEAALHKARAEAEARAQAERDKQRAELEAKARAEAEARIRAETEKKVREEAEAKLRAEAEAKAEAKAKAAREAAVRLAAEAKAKAEAEAQAKIEAERQKIEAERKAREEAERKAKEEAEKARREAEELRQRLEEERKAREAEERKRKEEEERRRKEEEARRAQEEAERKAREEAERKRREEEEARRRKEEEEARKRKEEEARKRKEEEERLRAEQERARQKEEEERRLKAQREEEERARKALEETKLRQATLAATPPPPPPPEPAPAPAAGEGPGSLDSLMADLDSFSQREEEERAARDAAERKQREDKKRKAKEEAERRAQEIAEQERRAADERRRREEEERRAQEEAERRLREAEEQRRLEAEERKRKAREAMEAAAAQAAAAPASAPRDAALPDENDDIGVTEDDLDMADVRRDEAAVAKDARKAQREREREMKQREREAKARAKAAEREEPVKYSKPRRPVKWGKPLAMTFFILLVVAIGALHVVPLPMQQYEDAATEALGRPVRIGTGTLSLFTGVRLNLENVTIGDNVRIATVHAYPRFGSLIDENKAFRRIELHGVTIPQQALADTLTAKVGGQRFNVGRLMLTRLILAGPVPVPPLEADAVLGGDGSVRSVTLRGPDELNVKLTPAGSSVEFDATAASFALPFAKEVSLNSFAMKGVANRQGMTVQSWGGSLYDGALSGTANVRWGNTWHIDGVVSVRNINAAVFAPALLSVGKADGTGKFSMTGPDPAKLASGTRLAGNFSVEKGVLGSFDLSRAIQSSGRQYAGTTRFVELTGQGVYDRGAVALRNIIVSAGALNAGASADIAQNGALNGRIVADVKTAQQSLRQTLELGGTVQEPQVRN
jgi:hypothetical protein